ncbi:phosphoserine phosphatase SerB [Diaphorobacter ruginosibacter]|uniref:phosphoserine phosphatase SerB n=1 Tax=Diaphorobacter ruginosibacter TaxID=1715720 RepID=UPI003340E22D
MKPGDSDGGALELRELSSGLFGRNLRLPLRLRDFRLIAFDMDSTLVASETVDELADLAGCKARIEAMTRAAMAGPRVDFEQNLRERLSLLAGVPASLLDRVRDERMPLTQGALELVRACRAHGLRCVLISGGFTRFADSLAERLGLDEIHANVLEVEAGVFTGRILAQPGRRFVDAAGKRERLLDACARLGISPAQSIAVGDGANDLAMLDAAGLSVAFHAKPAVRDRAGVAIDSGGLDRLLELFAD